MSTTESPQTFGVGVVEVVGDTICVAQDDGHYLFKVIHEALSEGKEVVLSFDGVESLTTAFLNAAIGQLLRHFDSEFLRSNLKFRDLTGEQMRLLKEVIEKARLYFSDPKRFEAARAQPVEV